MANELRLRFPRSAVTLYAQLGRTDGQLWNGTSFEAPLTGHWLSYTVALVEQSSTAYYYGSLPGGMPAGLYDYYVFQQAGANPAVSDLLVAQGRLDWNGSAESSLADVQARLPAALVGGRIDASVGDYPGNVPQSGDAYAALVTTAWPEASAAPAATATIQEQLAWLTALTTNEILQSSTQQQVRNSASTVTIASCNVSDDGALFTRSRFS